MMGVNLEYVISNIPSHLFVLQLNLQIKLQKQSVHVLLIEHSSMTIPSFISTRDLRGALHDYGYLQ